MKKDAELISPGMFRLNFDNLVGLDVLIILKFFLFNWYFKFLKH